MSTSDQPPGSRVLGKPDQSLRMLRLRVQLVLTSSLVLANVIGAVVVVALITLVLPGPSVFTGELLLVHTVVVPAYVLVALIIGITWGTRSGLHSIRWVFEAREPDDRDRKATLRVPIRLFGLQGVLWLGGAATFTTIFAFALPGAVFKVAFTTVFGGLVTCANSYLLTEWALRPIAARALSAGAPPRRKLVAGVAVRTVLSWGLGTAVPVAGLMLVAVFALVRGDVPTAKLAVAVITLGGVILVFGLLLTILMTRATVAPIRTVRRALANAQRGDLDSEVPVFDGTELGLLQSGFNRMVQGLRERERIRDLFGRHVGREIATDALSRQTELGGEVRDVAVLFVDVIGSTTMAAERAPADVVTTLNRFFAIVVHQVNAHGGVVNKFEGDAALAVFGAPSELDDSAGAALAAARAMGERLTAEITECAAGIGVSYGAAVAGNVGAESRFEYTVIGDPVNEAARLSELSKSVPGRIVAAMPAIEHAAEAESALWRRTESVTLRGRSSPTLLAIPSTAVE